VQHCAVHRCSLQDEMLFKIAWSEIQLKKFGIRFLQIDHLAIKIGHKNKIFQTDLSEGKYKCCQKNFVSCPLR